MSQDDQFTYQYDSEGNQIQKTDRVSGERTVFTYDHRNRLTTIERFNSAALIDRSTYTYDAANRRLRAEENGSVAVFGYDGLNPMLKLASAGQVISRRLYSRGLDGILADEMAGQTRWFMTDQVGTVRDLIGNDGSPITHYTYDSFGRLLAQSNPGVINDILFTSREFNPTTVLGYFRARFYEPRLGRFIGEDPLLSDSHLDPNAEQEFPRQEADANGYRYAGNAPTYFIDPYGLAAIPEYNLTASQFIARFCLGKVLREFPAELLLYTVAEILEGINGVDPKKLSKARKLLKDRRFRKAC